MGGGLVIGPGREGPCVWAAGTTGPHEVKAAFALSSVLHRKELAWPALLLRRRGKSPHAHWQPYTLCGFCLGEQQPGEDKHEDGDGPVLTRTLGPCSAGGHWEQKPCPALNPQTALGWDPTGLLMSTAHPLTQKTQLDTHRCLQDTRPGAGHSAPRLSPENGAHRGEDTVLGCARPAGRRGGGRRCISVSGRSNPRNTQ